MSSKKSSMSKSSNSSKSSGKSISPTRGSSRQMNNKELGKLFGTIAKGGSEIAGRGGLLRDEDIDGLVKSSVADFEYGEESYNQWGEPVGK